MPHSRNINMKLANKAFCNYFLKNLHFLSKYISVKIFLNLHATCAKILQHF